jgi:uracil-DNA glycosylase family 4
MSDKNRCTNCPLGAGVCVPGYGPMDADIVVIGESPGRDEEQSGVPFSGGAGRILKKHLFRAGINPDRCYFTNAVKCHGSSPTASEAAAKVCKTRLHAELHSLKNKKVIVPAGNMACQALSIDERISDIRGGVMRSIWGKVIPTYNPGSLMKNQKEHATATYDWRKIARHRMSPGMPRFPEDFNIEPSIIDVESFCREVLDRASDGPVDLAFDIETLHSEHYIDTPILMVGMSLDKKSGICVPFITAGGNYYWRSEDLAQRAVMAIGSVLESGNVVKIAHNVLFELTVMMNHGFVIQPPVFDTMIAHYLIYQPADHDLGFVASIYSDRPMWKQDVDWRDDTSVRTYNLRDCTILHEIKTSIELDMRGMSLRSAFDTRMRAVLPTAKMSLNGIHIDKKQLSLVDTELAGEIEKMTTDLRVIAEDPAYNPKSNLQTARVIFDKMKLRSSKKTKSGSSLSVDDDVIKKLIIKHPNNEFIQKFQILRKTNRQRDGYTKNMMIHPDGRAHTVFKMHRTTSGRYASSEPNLQNLPAKRTDKSGYIRRIFAVPPGKVMVAADLDQAELRVFATVTDDSSFKTAFERGDDIHEQTCKELFGEYREEWRTFTKNFEYGVVYGSAGSQIEAVAPREVLERINIKDMVSNWLARHPAITKYRPRMEDIIVKEKKVSSPFGVTRWFPGYMSKEFVRQGVNHPIQSSVADIMFDKMALLDDEINPGSDKLILQLHDALYFETDDVRGQQLAELVKDVLESPTTAQNGMVFQIPAEVKVGPNMADCE